MADYRDRFPGVHDERPQVLRVRFDNHSMAADRRVLATGPSFRAGGRVYVDMAGYGHPEEWAAAEIIESSDDLLLVKRIPEA